MNEQVTIRDVMSRDYVAVNEGDSLIGAAELMDEETDECAVVLRGQDAVGMVHAMDIVGLLADGTNLTETTVGETMTAPVTTLTPDADLSTAIRVVADGDARPAVVQADDQVLGIVSEHDIVTAYAVLKDLQAEEEPLAAPVADTGPVDAEYSDQGVCEVCGSLSQRLTDHNGQLVCPDCLTM